MNKRLKLATTIIILFFMLMFISVVFAEEKYVSTSLNIKILNRTMTVTVQNIFDQKTYKVVNISNYTNVNYDFPYTLKTELTCTQSELQNLTKQLIQVCNATSQHVKTCDSIYKTNTDLSFQIGGLKEKLSLMDSQPQQQCTNLQPELDACRLQMQTANNSTLSNNLLWGGAGVLIGIFGYMTYKNRGTRKGPEDSRY